jgi:hypothetical protein
MAHLAIQRCSKKYWCHLAQNCSTVSRQSQWNSPFAEIRGPIYTGSLRAEKPLDFENQNLFCVAKFRCFGIMILERSVLAGFARQGTTIITIGDRLIIKKWRRAPGLANAPSRDDSSL